MYIYIRIISYIYDKYVYIFPMIQSYSPFFRWLNPPKIAGDSRVFFCQGLHHPNVFDQGIHHQLETGAPGGKKTKIDVENPQVVDWLMVSIPLKNISQL